METASRPPEENWSILGIIRSSFLNPAQPLLRAAAYKGSGLAPPPVPGDIGGAAGAPKGVSCPAGGVAEDPGAAQALGGSVPRVGNVIR